MIDPTTQEISILHYLHDYDTPRFDIMVDDVLVAKLGTLEEVMVWVRENVLYQKK